MKQTTIYRVLCAAAIWLSPLAFSGETQSVSRILAEIAIESDPQSMSDRAYEKARMAVLDTIGNASAGLEAPGIPEVVAQMQEWGGATQSAVWFTDTKLPVLHAAYVNSAMAHAMDLDDWHRPSSTHISVICVPVAIAVAEWQEASGQECLDALIAGVEVAHLLGNQFKQYRQHSRFLPTSVIGGFGATATAARLMGLSVEETMDAYGLFFSMASGNRQSVYDRVLSKRLQPAHAAECAIMAASLAKRGLSGPENFVLSVGGLFKLYGDVGDDLPQPSDFRKTEASWAIEDIAFKKYACCGASHPAIEAGIELSERYDLEISEVAKLELFEIWVGSGMVDIPWKETEDPHVYAQFCAPYEVASAIKYRRFDPEQTLEDHIERNPDVIELAKAVEIKRKTDWGEGYPGGHTVRVTLKDGRQIHASSTPEAVFDAELFDWSMLSRKAEANMEFGTGHSKERANEVFQVLERFEQVERVHGFVSEYLVGKESR